jgi:hypothetical protein
VSRLAWYGQPHSERIAEHGSTTKEVRTGNKTAARQQGRNEEKQADIERREWVDQKNPKRTSVWLFPDVVENLVSMSVSGQIVA